MLTSKMANSVEPSKGRYLFNLASQYDNVINLTLGDPDIITPLSIRKAGCDAIMQGKTRYSANAGILDLRTQYSSFIEKKYNKKYDPQSQVMITVGGMEGLYLAMLSVLDPEDEVIIFSPYYINYYQMVQMCSATPVVIVTKESDGFVPRIEDIEKNITDKTKLIVMNTPGNPTGAVYPPEIVDGIKDIAKKHNILLISDEVYSTLIFDGKSHYGVLDSPVEYENVLLIDSCSKRFSMTGWRVGFAIGPAEWVKTMIKLQENVAACAPLPSQYAALEAFTNMPDMTDYVNEFEKRRDALVATLSKTDKLTFNLPKATFYLFVNVEKTGMQSMDFAVKLLEQKRVSVAPGIGYGDEFDNYIRIAFTLGVEKLVEAANRIVDFTGGH